MLIAFVGDVHGRVFDALAALATWQAETDRRLDLVIQVGDMGAYPDPARMDAPTRRYLELDPAEADFSRLLHAEGERAEAVRRLRACLAGPIYFLRGNHEDFDWLRGLPVDGASGTAQADRFDVLRYVPDGIVLEREGARIAFLGGIETPAPDARSHDEAAYDRLLATAPGTFDVLVTHDPPHGVSTGFYGQTQGSTRVLRLIEAIQPKYHVAGHLHHIIGPRRYGDTTYLGLSSLVASARWNPGARGLQSGCIGVLDTVTGDLWPVTDPWLAAFETPFDFDAWAEGFLTGRSVHASSQDTLDPPSPQPSPTRGEGADRGDSRLSG